MMLGWQYAAPRPILRYAHVRASRGKNCYNTVFYLAEYSHAAAAFKFYYFAAIFKAFRLLRFSSFPP